MAGFWQHLQKFCCENVLIRAFDPSLTEIDIKRVATIIRLIINSIRRFHFLNFLFFLFLRQRCFLYCLLCFIRGCTRSHFLFLFNRLLSYFLLGRLERWYTFVEWRFLLLVSRLLILASDSLRLLKLRALSWNLFIGACKLLSYLLLVLFYCRILFWSDSECWSFSLADSKKRILWFLFFVVYELLRLAWLLFRDHWSLK